MTETLKRYRDKSKKLVRECVCKAGKTSLINGKCVRCPSNCGVCSSKYNCNKCSAGFMRFKPEPNFMAM